MRWEDKYDLEYVIFNPLGNNIDFLRFDTKPEEIKSFIKSLLKEQREICAKELPYMDGIINLTPEEHSIYWNKIITAPEPEGK